MRRFLKQFLKEDLYNSVKVIYFKLRHLKMQIRGFFHKNGIFAKRYRTILKYKNKYCGQRCFIISMGPSLTLDDVNKLKGEYTFGMNSIIKLFSQTDWRPTFFGVQDKNVYENLETEIKESEIANVFVSDDLADRFSVPNEWIQYPLDLLDHNVNFTNFNTKFSGDCDQIVYDGYSITYSLLQIAVYMGFNEIFLLGNDCNYETPNSRFLDHGVGATDISTIGDRMISAYEVAKQYSESKNVKIFNATRGGKLEVFERVDFNEVIK